MLLGSKESKIKMERPTTGFPGCGDGFAEHEASVSLN